MKDASGIERFKWITWQKKASLGREEKSDEELNFGVNAGCVLIWRDCTKDGEWGWRAG